MKIFTTSFTWNKNSVLLLLLSLFLVVRKGSAQNLTTTTTTTSRRSNSSNQNYYSKLREYLLAEYDRHSFPFEEVQYYNETDGTIRGLDVQMNINFHKIRQLDVVGADADLIVWFRLYWTDPRLEWTPSEFGNISAMTFRIESGSGGSETSEIWTPEIYLWNAQEPVSKTLEDASVIVRPDGHCSWSRPGHLIAACKYRGLEDFPFDDLSCDLEFGTWSYSGKYIFPRHDDSSGGVSIGGSETAGQTYAEFELKEATTREHIYPPYPTAPSENWPVIFYTLTFSRAWQPYARGYIVFQIMMNLMAFGCFWLPPVCGERIALGITSMLSAIAGELVITHKIPPSGERSFYTDFSLVSVTFNAFVVFESVMVIYFYYYCGKTLIPSYITSLSNKLKNNLKKMTVTKEDNGNDKQQKEGEQTQGDESFQTPVQFAREGEGKLEILDDTAKETTIMMEASDGRLNSIKRRESADSYSFTPSEFSCGGQEPPPSSSQRGNFNKRYSRVYNSLRDFSLGEEAANNNAGWQTIANRMDDFCRAIIVPTYVVMMAVILGNASSSS